MTPIWIALGFLGALLLAARGMRPWCTRWGATLEEREGRIPGLEHLDGARVTSTHAITIDAPAREVWPWLVQMGVGRGGFYSYAWLENLVGCGVRNAQRIVPELQDLAEGDAVVLHPKAPPLRVTRLVRERLLALEGWVFQLVPISPDRTRLVTRTYAVPVRSGQGLVAGLVDLSTRTALFDLAHFVMGRKQLLELRRRAEARHRVAPRGTRAGVG